MLCTSKPCKSFPNFGKSEDPSVQESDNLSQYPCWAHQRKTWAQWPVLLVADSWWVRWGWLISRALGPMIVRELGRLLSLLTTQTGQAGNGGDQETFAPLSG